MTEYRITTFDRHYRIEERDQLGNGAFTSWAPSRVLRAKSLEELRDTLESLREQQRLEAATWVPVEANWDSSVWSVI